MYLYKLQMPVQEILDEYMKWMNFKNDEKKKILIQLILK